LLDLLVLPIGLGVSVVDEYALDTRLFEFLEFFHGWISVSPRVKFSFSGSLALGVWVESAKLASERAALRVGGLVRTNADFQAAIEYRHVLLLPDGRGLRARAYIDHDKNRRYYGIGGDSAVADQRVIRAISSGATVDVDLQGIDRYTYSGVAGLGFIRQRFTPGIDTTIPALAANDTIPLPPGFDVTALYVTGSLSGRYDTRDSNGRPVRGAYAEISAVAREEITGKQLSAITASATITKLLPLIAEHRTILVTLGGAASIPLGAGDTIPLDALPEISRLNNRGYDSDRFRDRYAVVGSVEYRFPVYDYLASRAGLDAFVFVDTGTLWGTNKLTDSRIRYSVGTGLRAASQNDLMFSMTLAGSPDGIQFAVGVEGQ
ncbi:MAG: BamA/TamA family outer membrane protein, partial [Kofleriaceae bacterium]